VHPNPETIFLIANHDRDGRIRIPGSVLVGDMLYGSKILSASRGQQSLVAATTPGQQRRAD
jgi:hypothetical protein